MFSGKPDRSLTWTPESIDNIVLYGKHMLVVGGTSGIGRAIARLMAKQGADVTVVGRSFRDTGTPGIRFVQANLDSMAEARRLAEALPAELFSVVVFTAGTMSGPARRETPEGLEEHLAVNYLSRIVMLREMGNRLGTHRAPSASKPRVFIMGFPGTNIAGNVKDLNSTERYRPRTAHMNAVAGNEALVYDTDVRYPNLNAYGLNPGLIKPTIRGNILGGTESLRFRMVESMVRMVGISPEVYASKILPLLVSRDIEDASGSLFNQNGDAILRSKVMTDETVQQYVDTSESLLFEARAILGDGEPTPLPLWLCPPQYQRQSRTPLPF